MKFTDVLVSAATRHPILKRVTPHLGNAALAVKRVSPEIYLVGGIVAGVAAGVLAARAYKKHDEVLTPIGDDIRSESATLDSEEASNQQRAKVLSPMYGEYTARFIGLYGSAMAAGATSVYLILTSHGILKGRNRALVAGLQLAEAGYKKYRERVVDELGPEADERFHLGAEKRKVTVVEADEDGKTKKRRMDVNTIPEDPDTSMYAVVFDEANVNWVPDKEVNGYFLQVAQSNFNKVLDIVGHVTLNDVKDYLRMPRTPEGQIVGWSKKAPGDNWVSFGLDKPINRMKGDNRFILDFNVNGSVFEYVDGEGVGQIADNE